MSFPGLWQLNGQFHAPIGRLAKSNAQRPVERINLIIYIMGCALVDPNEEDARACIPRTFYRGRRGIKDFGEAPVPRWIKTVFNLFLPPHIHRFVRSKRTSRCLLGCKLYRRCRPNGGNTAYGSMITVVAIVRSGHRSHQNRGPTPHSIGDNK